MQTCETCDGTGRFILGKYVQECVDCGGKGHRTAEDVRYTKAETLAALREWFAGEVAAGDTALQMWVERIDKTL